MLKHNVHDWDEFNAVQILRNVRAAMTHSAKLLVIESDLPDDNREHTYRNQSTWKCSQLRRAGSARPTNTRNCYLPPDSDSIA